MLPARGSSQWRSRALQLNEDDLAQNCRPLLLAGNPKVLRGQKFCVEMPLNHLQVGRNRPPTRAKHHCANSVHEHEAFLLPI
jgi:hypothetical protein